MNRQANLDLSQPSLKHLQLELARIDILIRREVRRWRLANQAPADSFRGFYVSHEDAEALLNRAFATSWGQTATLPPAEAEMFEQARREAERRSRVFAEAARREGHLLRLAHLAQVFELDQFELDTLLICLAPTLDLRYEQLYGYLQDHVARRRPTVNLVMNLLGPPGPDRLPLMAHFSPEARLFKHQILKYVAEPGQPDPPLLSQTLALDQTIVAWLWGEYQPRPELGPQAAWLQPQPGLVDALLPETIRQNLADIQHQPVIVFHGPDRGGQEAAAKFIAAERKRSLLLIDLSAVVSEQFSPLPALRLALRDARLTGAIPGLFGWDACLDSQDKKTPSYLLAELSGYPDIVIVAGQEKWQSGGLEQDRLFSWQAFDIPDYNQRRTLWGYFLQAHGKGVGKTGEAKFNLPDTTQLADQFYLTTDQIRDAVATARDMAGQLEDPITLDHLYAAARSHSSARLANLAQKITPRYDWDDIILPDDQLKLLREIVNAVQSRSKVLEAWQVGKKLASSKGITMLFGGPPGTGKTMAAEVMAHNLGLDLYKIDLSTVVSKYIGETEKNLERIFKDAESSNAILFFDEADALFGKRSEVRDAHDRFANIEISYLLQRMESYEGVTILATNLRANLDEAFTRRLHYVVDFPLPDEADRYRIWQSLFPQTVPRYPDLDFKLMARRFKLTGGNIRNIIINAAYLAAADGDQVTMAHLLHSTTRELQKMGRIISEADIKLE
jgi:AAA+ superfamily predicted ATPase